MKRKTTIILAIILAATITTAGAFAYFSDVVSSNNNNFAAGSLILNVDGQRENIVKFSVSNMQAGNQPKRSYVLDNVGTLNGYIDIEVVGVTDYENVRIQPEIDAGDTTDGVGELSQVLNLRLFIDYGGDGWVSAGDITFFNGKMDTLPANFELDEPLNAGDSLNIVAIVDWWSTAMDNQVMTDSVDLGLTFELAQTVGQ